MNSHTNPSSPETSTPVVSAAAQLADARLRQWHQQGEALLTVENLRSWINSAGLVLFAPRPQIVSPAPSLVEAVLGAPNSNPTLQQIAEASSLLARLVAEGLAVPLNLLGAGPGTVHAGAPGDTPDFVASAAIFSYVFTLRGDKAWKQPPAASGAFKLSPLALAIHEALARRAPLSAYDLTTEVGKEVTEAAVLRSLAELWTHLRVLPLPQPGDAPTLWELASARFTKQIKAGANAGQPSALSALISLYLGQSLVASEDEIESFLSPLAARSRIRDVIHALISARQIDTLAIEGRTMLYVAGALPDFLAPHPAFAASGSQAGVEVQSSVADSLAAVADGASSVVATDAAAPDESQTEEPADAFSSGEAPRIAKFIPRPRKIGTGYLTKAKPSKFGAKPFTKPFAKPFAEKKFPSPHSAARPGFKPRPSGEFKPRSSDSKFKPRPDSKFKPRPSGEFKPRSSDSKFKPRPDSKFKPRPSGEFKRRPTASRPTASHTSARPAFKSNFKPRTSGEFKPRTTDSKFKPRPDSKFKPRPTTSRPTASHTSARPAFKSNFKPRTSGEFKPRPSGEFKPRSSDSKFKPRPDSKFKPRPNDGKFKPRPIASRPAASHTSAKPAFKSSFKPRPNGKSTRPSNRGPRTPDHAPKFKPRKGGPA